MPDGPLRLVFEYRLVGARRAVALTFQSLMGPVKESFCPPGSRFVGVPVDDRSDALPLHRVGRRRYSLVPPSPGQKDRCLRSTTVRTGVNRREFARVFGEEFEPLRDRTFRLADLRWFDAPEAGEFKPAAALRSAPKSCWHPPPSKALRKVAREEGISLGEF